MALENIVRVSADIATGATAGLDFGRTLFLQPVREPITADEVEAFVGDTRVYVTLASVTNDWGTTSEVGKAAAIYFQQTPFPKPFVVAPYFLEDVRKTIVGGTPTSITSAATDITFAGVTREVTLGSTVDIAATALQTAFRGDPASAGDGAAISDIVFEGIDANGGTGGTGLRIRVRIPINNTSIDLADFANGFTGTSASSIKLGSSDIVYSSTGGEADTETGQPSTLGVDGLPSTALSRIQTKSPNFFWVTLSNDVETEIGDNDIYIEQVLAVANWAGGNQKFLVVDNNDAATLGETVTTGGTLLNQLSLNRSLYVTGFWSVERDYKAVSLAGRFSSVNFNAPVSLITGKFKQLLGTAPDNQLTNSEFESLTKRRINTYRTVGGSNIVEEGSSFGQNGWIDVQYWLAWFVATCQTELYSLLLTSRRLPQTSSGAAQIKATIERVCSIGLINGGIAPGQLDQALANEIRSATGNTEFTGFLSTGYLVHVPSFSTQTLADRQARKSTPPSVWLKGSGAVHSIQVQVRFEP